jgi:hypothetical protein
VSDVGYRGEKQPQRISKVPRVAADETKLAQVERSVQFVLEVVKAFAGAMRLRSATRQ